MLRIVRLSCISIGFLLLQGCATLSKEECIQGNWYTIGYTDGAKGKSLDRLGSHAKACADYSVAPNRADYMAGRRIGLTYHCANSQAYKREPLAIQQDNGDWEAIGREAGQQGIVAATALREHRRQCAHYGVEVDELGYNRGHSDGIVVYCQPSNGYQQGKHGKPYQGACPIALESGFLGRYLAGLNQKMTDIQQEINENTDELGEQALHIAQLQDQNKISSMQNQIERLTDTIEDLRTEYQQLQRLHNSTTAYLSRLRVQ